MLNFILLTRVYWAATMYQVMFYSLMTLQGVKQMGIRALVLIF